MSYQTLARKYRPSNFSEIIGQEAATRTLTNSIEKERVGNAYIFCGPRGIGKTSMARLLAKTLNCEGAVDEKPCDKCASCIEIAQSRSIDVLEIDGASNNGVDEIRALRENVKFSPSRGKYKIYIIDEVHMLSPGAFNALLKTLEEPPGHVKFIFATTEPHKVLPTILSRCQRFDFRKIPSRLILERITDISCKEGIQITESAGVLLARAADGSLRDALVVLDQMISFSSGKISSEDVVELLGIIHAEKIFELAGTVLAKDPAKTVKVFDEIVSSGKDPAFINSSLISHFRDLMVIKVVGGPLPEMALSKEEIAALSQQQELISLDEILYILQNLTHCGYLMKGAMFARGPLEVALVRMARRETAMKIPDMIARLESAGKNMPIPMGTGSAKENKLPAETRERVAETGDLAEERYSEGRIDPGPFKEISNAETGSVNIAGGDNFSEQRNHWKTLLNYLKNRKMSVFLFLNNAQPLEMAGDSLVMGFDRSNLFSKEALETGSNLKALQEAADKIMGQPVRISFKLVEDKVKELKENIDVSAKKARSKEEMNPAIEKAMDVFGGHVVRDFMEGYNA